MNQEEVLEVIKKIKPKFKHDSEYMFEALGLTKEQTLAVGEYVHGILEQVDNIPDAVNKIYNEIDNQFAGLLVAWCLGIVDGENRATHQPVLLLVVCISGWGAVRKATLQFLKERTAIPENELEKIFGDVFGEKVMSVSQIMDMLNQLDYNYDQKLYIAMTMGKEMALMKNVGEMFCPA